MRRAMLPQRVFRTTGSVARWKAVVMTSRTQQQKAREQGLRLNKRNSKPVPTDAGAGPGRMESERRAAELEAIMEQAPAAVWITRDPRPGPSSATRQLPVSGKPGTKVSQTVKESHYKLTSGVGNLGLLELPMQRARQGGVVVGQEVARLR